MVKKLLFFLAYFLVFILALIAFIPKESVYYFAEQQIAPYDVVIANEKTEDKFFSFEVDDATLYAQKIEAATIEKSEVTILGVYNSVNVEGIALASIVESFLPSKIEHVSISYSIIDPLHLNVAAEGAFGVLSGAVNILDRKVEVVLQPSKLMLSKYRTTLKEFKKQSNGEYTYAKAL